MGVHEGFLGPYCRGLISGFFLWGVSSLVQTSKDSNLRDSSWCYRGFRGMKGFAHGFLWFMGAYESSRRI